MSESSSQSKTVLVSAKARSLRISPRKLRLVADSVRGLPVDKAVANLKFTHKKAAAMIAKLVDSAVANAVNNHNLAQGTLKVKAISCDMGPVMKRYFPRAQGRAFIIRRKTAAATIVLEGKLQVTEKKAAVKEKTKTPAKKKADFPTEIEKVDKKTTSRSRTKVKTSEDMKLQEELQAKRDTSSN